MSANSDLLTLSHWLSPVFPVGGYAHSQGLEYAIHAGDVKDAGSLQSWLEVVLRDGTGQVDAVLLMLAMKPEADHADLAAWARALAGSRERAQDMDEQGAAFTDAVNAVTERQDTAVPFPVAVGRAAQKLDLPAEQVAALYLQSMVANLVTGAVRHVPLGQADGQRVIAALQPLILEVVADAMGRDLDGLRTMTPGADLASMRHETQEVRIFRT